MLPAILSALNPIKEIAGKIADHFEGKRDLIAALATLESNLLVTAIEYEKASLQVKADAIKTEAQGQSWLQRSWRPITMLTFLCLVVLDQTGLLAFRLAEEAWTLLQLGLGGYVAGRSVEKIATTVAPAIRDMNLRRKKD